MMSGDTMEMLRDTVNRALGDTVSAQGTLVAEAQGIDRAAWRQLTELGLTGAEAAGLSPSELAVVLQAVGYAAALVPYAESECLGRWLAGAAGVETDPAEVLSLLVVNSSAIKRGKGSAGSFAVLSGQHIPWGRHANRIVLSFSKGQTHFAAVVLASELAFEPAVNLAGEPYDRCTTSRVRIDAIHELPPSHGVPAVRRRGAFCRIAAMLGAGHRINELTLQYAADRKQFGKSLSQFQMIQSYLAEMAAEQCAASVMFETALEAVGDDFGGDGAELAAAKVRMGQAAQRTTALAHQIHGAIGFTQEYPLHLWSRRLWAWREEYGNETEWARELGTTIIALGADSYWERITK